MRAEEFKQLDVGDIVEDRSGRSFMVTANYGSRVTAVATADLTHPEEWLLVNKVEKRKRPTRRVPPTIELLDCGCTVSKGWRCPVHGAP